MPQSPYECCILSDNSIKEKLRLGLVQVGRGFTWSCLLVSSFKVKTNKYLAFTKLMLSSPSPTLKDAVF
jgi:hypothetical protein